VYNANVGTDKKTFAFKNMICNLSNPVDFEGNTPTSSSTIFSFNTVTCDEVSATSSVATTTLALTFVSTTMLFLIFILLNIAIFSQLFFGNKKKVPIYNEILGNNTKDGKKQHHD